MTDRERVIFDIERCICHVPDACKDCSKYGGDSALRCMEDLLKDALELLKEQEPVAHATWLCEETSTAYDLYGVKTWAAKYKCSKCGSVHRAIEAHMCYSYCPMCGARMDEEAKEGGSECG